MANGESDDNSVKDLTTVGRPDTGTGGAPQVKEEKFDKVKAQESVRAKIALCLVGTFVVFIALVLLAGLATQIYCAYSEYCDADTTELKSLKSIVELLLTPLVGLVGAVTGFYFGEKSASASGEE